MDRSVLGMSVRSAKLHPFISWQLSLVNHRDKVQAVPLKSRHKNTSVGTEFVTRDIVGNKTLVAVSYLKKKLNKNFLPETKCKELMKFLAPQLQGWQC